MPTASSANRLTAIKSWDNALDHLDSTLHLYTSQTTTLFDHFDHDGADSSSRQPELSVEDALQHIDSRLRHLEKLEEELHMTRVALQGLRNRSIKLSPVVKLPPEIIGLVIHHGYEDDRVTKLEKELRREEDDEDEDDEEEEEPDPPHFPTVMSHVCKRWRRIATETAPFWTNIDFHEGPPFERAREWLARSGDCPLEVVLDVEDDQSELGELEQLQQATDMLLGHSNRIASLYIRIGSVFELAKVIADLIGSRNPMPLLSLALIVDEVDSNLLENEELLDRQLILQKTLSGVEALELEKVHLPWEHAAIGGLNKLRLSSLTVAEEVPTTEQFAAILKRSPGLKMLNIDAVDFPSPEIPLTPQRIRLSNLTDLFLTQLQDNAASFVFAIIETPSISYLRLGDIEFSNADVNASFVKFAKLLQPTSLLSLRIDSCEFTYDSLILLLSHAQALQYLKFNDCALEGPLFDWMRREPGCPELDVLEFDSCHSLNEDKLKRFVKARQDSTHPLQKITVKWCSADSSLEEWLKQRVPEVVWEADSDDEMEDENEGDMTTDGEDVEIIDVDMLAD